MNHIVRIVLLAGVSLAPTSVGASFTVTPGLTVHNKCHKDIVIAVRYRDGGGTWRTTPFNSIPARARRSRVVSSDNSIFYYYAESTSGKPSRWTGDHNVRVEGKVYPMRRKELDLDRDDNRYSLELTCSN